MSQEQIGWTIIIMLHYFITYFVPLLVALGVTAFFYWLGIRKGKKDE